MFLVLEDADKELLLLLQVLEDGVLLFSVLKAPALVNVFEVLLLLLISSSSLVGRVFFLLLLLLLFAVFLLAVFFLAVLAFSALLGLKFTLLFALLFLINIHVFDFHINAHGSQLLVDLLEFLLEPLAHVNVFLDTILVLLGRGVDPASVFEQKLSLVLILVSVLADSDQLLGYGDHLLFDLLELCLELTRQILHLLD